MEENKMTPADALNIIDRVLSNVTGTRQDHELLKQAIDVLRNQIGGYGY